jgi:hypothetical protein
MDSKTDTPAAEAPDLADSNWKSVARKSKSPQAQRSTRRESGKKVPKSSKSNNGKRSSTGLHDMDSDISRDRQTKKPPQPSGKPNGDLRTMFIGTKGGGTTTTPPYVPDPIAVTKIMRDTTKKAISRSVSPKTRAASTVQPNPTTTPKLGHTAKDPPNEQPTIPTIIPDKMNPITPKLGHILKDPPIEQPTTPTFTAEKLLNDKITKTNTRKITNENPKKTSEGPTKHKKHHQKTDSVTNDTIPTQAQKATFATPAKTINHPTRSFPIPATKTGGSLAKTTTDATSVGPSNYSPPINPMGQSPTRTTPFTTSLVHPTPLTGMTATQAQLVDSPFFGNPTPTGLCTPEPSTSPTSKLPAKPTASQPPSKTPLVYQKPLTGTTATPAILVYSPFLDNPTPTPGLFTPEPSTSPTSKLPAQPTASQLLSKTPVIHQTPLTGTTDTPAHLGYSPFFGDPTTPAIFAPRMGTSPRKLPADSMGQQLPSPIQYYKDPMSTPGDNQPATIDWSVASLTPHMSEPPLDPDGFPAPDPEDPDPIEGKMDESEDGDQSEPIPLDPPEEKMQDSDEGYKSTNEDMPSDDDETTGTQSHGDGTNLENQDEASAGESTNTTNSNGASTNTRESQQSTQNQSVGLSKSQHSDSSDHTNDTDLTAATPPRNNRTDMDCDSDDDADPADINLICPHPNHFKTFWRADYVTTIPTNTNPVQAVAAKLGETLAILQTIDKDTSVYPYESNPSLKPIHDPAAFLSLGTDLYAYADKNNLWKYPKKEMKTCRLILCLAMNSEFRNTCDAFNRLAEDSQLYPRALNYPQIGRAGFFPMSHPHQMSDKFVQALQKELKQPIGLEWRKAVPSIDLSNTDAKPGPNGRVDIPAAITVECRDGDEPAIRQRLTELFPAIPRANRFSYLCGMRMVFIHAYNPKEKDTVLPESRDNVARAWNLQKSANNRMRTASLNGIVRHPVSFDQLVSLDPDEEPVHSLKNAILTLQVPYVDTRKQYAPVFESVEYTRRRVLQKWENPELFVVFLPQHEKYASNVIDNMALHLQHQLRAPDEYLQKVFRRVHIRQQATRQWNKEHKKVFSAAHMSAAISDQHMAHHFADLNIDMALVHQDAAKKTTVAGADAGSIPKASDSQHLSIGMASLLGEDAKESDIFYRAAAPKSTPVTDGISYAAMLTTPTPTPLATPLTTPASTAPATKDKQPRSRSGSRGTREEQEARKVQSTKSKSKNTSTPAPRRSHTAPEGAAPDDLSTITAEDSRPPTVATISVGTLSLDHSSITADTAALLQAQHEAMEAKLFAQETKFNEYIKSIQQSTPTPTSQPNLNLTSGTAHNHGGGPII